jgi:sugar lactone lactonase YvrE
MKHSALSSLSVLSLFIGTLSLVGCGGAVNFPDAVVNPQVKGPAIQGSVFGGHAPIVGAHIYLLQPGTSGIGSPATSLLTGTSASGFALTVNSATSPDPNVPAGAEYETSDSGGNWNLTGGYSCTANEPVYVYAYGGQTPNTQPPTTEKDGSTVLTTADISQIVVSNAVVDSQTGTATYAITVNSNEQLTAGEAVTIVGLTGNLAVLNGAQTVLASPAPTATTFSVTASDVYGNYAGQVLGFDTGPTYYDSVADGTYNTTSGPNGVNGGGNDNGFTFDVFGLIVTPDWVGTTGTGTPAFGTAGTAAGQTPTLVPATNPITQLAVLGVCPANGTGNTGSFSGTSAISFVFMNEVSTVAAAYVFQPYTSASNNTAWDIGSTGTTAGLAGINIAAQTAAQLYDIEGSVVSTTFDGEGHIANSKTMSSTGTANGGTGVVSQNTLDSLANILAMCIDSTPTPEPGGGNFISTPCNTLFNTATDNGEINGTAPTDTATAAINIARYPAGNHSDGAANVDATYVSDLNGIVSGTVPYAPSWGTNNPNDWSVYITYTGGGITETNGTSPHSIAVDGSGNIYNANFGSSTFSKISALGIPAASANGAFNGLDNPVSVAIDGIGDVWLANSGASTVSRCTEAGVCAATTLDKAGPSDAEIDGSGHVWVTTGTTAATRSLEEITTPGVRPTVDITANLSTPNSVAIDEGPTGDIWVADSGENDASQCLQTGRNANTCTANDKGGITTPNGVAIDNAENVWVTNSNGTVSALNNAGDALAGSPYALGVTSAADGIAIDGANNVWVTNSTSFGVYELTNAGGVISPAAGYKTYANQTPNNFAADGIAIDGSGNVWYNTANKNDLVEIVGAASPAVTPLSTAVTNSTLGTNP